MKLKWFSIAIRVLSAVIIYYIIWSGIGRHGTGVKPDLRLVYTNQIAGAPVRGNIVAIQPYMFPYDYASEETFSAKLDGYFREAKERGWLDKNSVVVLPEYLGAWLVVEGEKSSVYTAPTSQKAFETLVLSNLVQALTYRGFAPCRDKMRYGIFRMKAIEMAKVYDKSLSSLAEEYGVTIVGGSIILPSPREVNGHLKAGNGPLYNVSPVYNPDGRLAGNPVVKVFPTGDETSWISAGKVENLPVFDTPLGRTGVLICADSWAPEAFETLKRKGAECVLVVSYINGDNKLEHKWKGYSGRSNPSDVDPSDVGKISEGDAWMKYAMPGRLPKSGIPIGVIDVLRGRLWDLGADGSIITTINGKTLQSPIRDGGAIVRITD